MKNVLIPWIKSLLLTSELTAALLAADAGIQKQNLGSGITTLITSNIKRRFPNN